MTESTLRASLNLVLRQCTADDSVRILWHAGEPLTVGLPFYERASEVIRECNSGGAKISQVIQTNGTLIDQRWCRWFVGEQIHVGLSVDGPAIVHDHTRRTLGNRPSFARVSRGISLLREYGLPLQAIAVLTPHSFAFPDEIFDFFSAAGFEWVGFNLEETEGLHASSFGDRRTEFGRLRKEYIEFMARLFERWEGAGRRPRIREFETMSLAIGAFLDDQSFVRSSEDSIPLRNIVVTRTGAISTFSPELASGTPNDPLHFSIGNVHEGGSLDDLRASSALLELAREIGKGVARCHDECEYFAICGGGSASNKFYEHGTFDCAETVTCALHRKALADVVADGLRRRSRSKALSATRC
jgi:uncharacterized protein